MGCNINHSFNTLPQRSVQELAQLPSFSLCDVLQPFYSVVVSRVTSWMVTWKFQTSNLIGIPAFQNTAPEKLSMQPDSSPSFREGVAGDETRAVQRTQVGGKYSQIFSPPIFQGRMTRTLRGWNLLAGRRICSFCYVAPSSEWFLSRLGVKGRLCQHLFTLRRPEKLLGLLLLSRWS